MVPHISWDVTYRLQHIARMILHVAEIVNLKQYIFRVYSQLPTARYADRQSNVGIMHAPMAVCTEHYKVFRRQAFDRRIGGKMK